MEPALRKSKLHFATTARAAHLTFDDRQTIRRCFPWLHFAEARWEHDEPGTFRIEIGEWIVTITGHNLTALFAAIEEQTLLRLCAHPEFDGKHERNMDTFATEIRFIKSPGKQKSPQQFPLDGVLGDLPQ